MEIPRTGQTHEVLFSPLIVKSSSPLLEPLSLDWVVKNTLIRLP